MRWESDSSCYTHVFEGRQHNGTVTDTEFYLFGTGIQYGGHQTGSNYNFICTWDMNLDPAASNIKKFIYEVKNCSILFCESNLDAMKEIEDNLSLSIVKAGL